jgi:hypothetical protein
MLDLLVKNGASIDAVDINGMLLGFLTTRTRTRTRAHTHSM